MGMGLLETWHLAGPVVGPVFAKQMILQAQNAAKPIHTGTPWQVYLFPARSQPAQWSFQFAMCAATASHRCSAQIRA